MAEKQKTYVFEGTEVKLTGRTAVTKNELLAKKGGTAAILHEIVPASQDFMQWVKWVRIDQLFEVQQ